MATDAETRNQRLIEQNIRELERRAYDRIRVYNPTKEQFTVVYDGYKHFFEPEKETIVFRHIWDRYKVKMTDHLITTENEARVEKENKHRIKSGQKAMDHQERELFDLRTNNSKLVKKYMSQLYEGVEERNASDEKGEKVVTKPTDQRPLHEQIAGDIEKDFAPLPIDNKDLGGADDEKLPPLEAQKEELKAKVEKK